MTTIKRVDEWDADDFPVDVPDDLPTASAILPPGYWLAVEFGDEETTVHLLENDPTEGDLQETLAPEFPENRVFLEDEIGVSRKEGRR